MYISVPFTFLFKHLFSNDRAVVIPISQHRCSAAEKPPPMRNAAAMLSQGL